MSIVRPVSEVLTDIVQNVQEIIHAEIQLARTQVRDEIRSSRPAAVLIGVGVLGLALSALFLLLCIDEALSLVIPTWAASLIVGAALAVIAVVTLTQATRRIQYRSRRLRNASQGTKESVEWIRNRNR
jgi:Putative Actinobacterial Holin-X, holin superfamily III